MLNVPIDRIVPASEARESFNKIVNSLDNEPDGLYVLTKAGKPALALITIEYLKSLINAHGVENLITPTPAKAAEPKATVRREKLPAQILNPILTKKTADVTTAVEEKLPGEKSVLPPTVPVSKPVPTFGSQTFEPPQVKTVVPPTKPLTSSTPPSAPSNPTNFGARAPIDPSWTGAPAVTPAVSSSKLVNPWPIIPPKLTSVSVVPPKAPVPVMTPVKAAMPVISPIAPPVNPAPAPAAPSIPLPPAATVQPVIPTTPSPAPKVDLPPPPPNPISMPFSATAPTVAPVTPPPANPPATTTPATSTTIPFSEPPKDTNTDGEPVPINKPAAPAAVASPSAPVNPATPTSPAPQPTVEAPVQDIEI